MGGIGHDHDRPGETLQGQGPHQGGDGHLVGLGEGVGDDQVPAPGSRVRSVHVPGQLGGLAMGLQHVSGKDRGGLPPVVDEHVHLEMEAGQAGGLVDIGPQNVVLGVPGNHRHGVLGLGVLVVVVDGVHVGHARQDDLPTAREADLGVGRDAADPDSEVCLGHLPVDEQPGPPTGRSHIHAVLVRIVIEDPEPPHDLGPQLGAKLLSRVCSVTPQGAYEGDVLLVHAPGREFPEHDGGDLPRPGGPGDVVKHDHCGALPPGQILQGGRPDGLPDGLGHLRHAQRRPPGPPHGAELHLPVLGQIDLQIAGLVPEKLRQTNPHDLLPAAGPRARPHWPPAGLIGKDLPDPWGSGETRWTGKGPRSGRRETPRPPA